MIPPPAPASAPQENWPLFQISLSAASEHSERPAPVKVLEVKKLVVVAFELVELTAVKFWRVDEPVARMFPRVARPDELITLANRLVEKRLVVVA